MRVLFIANQPWERGRGVDKEKKQTKAGAALLPSCGPV